MGRFEGVTIVKKGAKTNVIRYLEQRHIRHETLEYEVDESNLSAQHIADLNGMPIDMLYKTIVCRGDKTGVLLACIPGHLEVDMKKLAKASHNKKVESVSLKEVLPLTGYIRGGVSPIGCKKDYPLYISEEVRMKEKISISAGARGHQVIVAPDELIQIRQATVCAITKE